MSSTRKRRDKGAASLRSGWSSMCMSCSWPFRDLGEMDRARLQIGKRLPSNSFHAFPYIGSERSAAKPRRAAPGGHACFDGFGKSAVAPRKCRLVAVQEPATRACKPPHLLRDGKVADPKLPEHRLHVLAEAVDKPCASSRPPGALCSQRVQNGEKIAAPGGRSDPPNCPERRDSGRNSGSRACATIAP